MKRIISILLSICILCGNTGWALSAHYCMGERVGINLRHIGFAADEHECSKCGMKKAVSKNGCCHDEEIIFKATQDALSMTASIHITIDVIDLPSQQIFIPQNDRRLYAPQQSGLFQPHGPPGTTGPPLFIRHCAFLI